MKNENENLNIRKMVKEELKKRRISLKYLSDEEIDKRIKEKTSEIENQINNEVNSIVQLISAKVNLKSKQDRVKAKISREDRRKILEELLAGKTPEEIHKSEELKKYSLVDITIIENKNKARILAVQLMPIAKIAELTGIKKENIYANLYQFNIDGKNLSQVRKEKEEEVVRRLENGENSKSILNDKVLNVCIEGISSIQNKIEKKKKMPITKISKEDKQSIATLFIQGRTLEEIKQIKGFENMPSEVLNQIWQKNIEKILAMKLVPIKKIEAEVNLKAVSIYANCRNFKIKGKNIMELRKEKLTQLRQRLKKGESIEELLQDRELNVCREIIEKEQKRLEQARHFAYDKDSKGERTNKEVEGKKDNNRDAMQEKKKSDEDRRIETNKDQEERFTDTKLQIMRKKYKIKYMSGIENFIEKGKRSRLTPKENEEINQKLLEMLDIIDKFDVQDGNYIELIKSIVSCAKLVNEKNIDINQARQLIDIMKNDKIQYALKHCKPKIRGNVNKLKVRAQGKLVKNFEEEVGQASDLETLKELQKRVKTYVQNGYEYMNAVNASISNKIQKLQMGEWNRQIREDIPKEIKLIISDIAKGKLDINIAKNIIAEQARKKIKGRKITRFSLTEEQERKQFLSKIDIALREQGLKYPIEDPEKTMQILQELTTTGLTMRLNIVVSNLLERKKFNQAKELCKKYERSKDNYEDNIYIYNLEKTIRNAEIGDIVYRAIYSDMSPEEETKFWISLQEGLRKGNVKMKSVPLGKTQDGLRNITLQDVWPEDIKEITY